MKRYFTFAICLFTFYILPSQVTYEYLLYNAETNEFDVIGEDSYEKNNRTAMDITSKLDPLISSSNHAEPIATDNFEAKNLGDGNMKTCWLSSNDGKNESFEIIIDLEEIPSINTAQIKDIYFFNGWRKDFHTWKDYSRIKKVTMIVNDLPYAEISFEDTYKLQSIDLDKFKIDKTKRCRIRFKISEVYPGDKYQHVAMSDVQFIGKVK